jgi:deoxyxylulose-5-phosphate synthase
MIIYAPINEIALQNILYTAQLGLDHPIAIRIQEVGSHSRLANTTSWQI